MNREDLARRLACLRGMFLAGELLKHEFRLLRRGAALAYQLEQPRRKAARRRVQTECESGRMERPGSCSACGARGPVQAHHPNHDEALQVTWLCRSHHLEADRALCRVLAGSKYGESAPLALGDKVGGP